jgi:hypothetical protein
VADVVRVEGDAGRRLAQQPGKSSFAHLDWEPAQVLAVDEQVEGAEPAGPCSAANPPGFNADV